MLINEADMNKTLRINCDSVWLDSHENVNSKRKRQLSIVYPLNILLFKILYATACEQCQIWCTNTTPFKVYRISCVWIN